MDDKSKKDKRTVIHEYSTRVVILLLFLDNEERYTVEISLKFGLSCVCVFLRQRDHTRICSRKMTRPMSGHEPGMSHSLVVSRSRYPLPKIRTEISSGRTLESQNTATATTANRPRPHIRLISRVHLVQTNGRMLSSPPRNPWTSVSGPHGHGRHSQILSFNICRPPSPPAPPFPI